MPFLGRFTEDGKSTGIRELGVEEYGCLTIGGTGNDLVEPRMPVYCDERRAWRDGGNKLWSKCRWIENVEMARLGTCDYALHVWCELDVRGGEL